MELRQGSQRALGSLRAARSAAEIWLLRLPDGVVVGPGQSGEGGIALVIGLSRRELLGIGAGALASGTVRFDAQAQPVQQTDEVERHGMSSFGDLKYPADFAHFDFVDPKAPKGGAFSQIGPGTIYNQNSQTFNSLNSYILRGDAAQGMELTFASLMARAEDEPDAMYGLAARAVRVSSDGLTYRFLMRSGITFHDGSALTAHDVAFSLKIL